MKPKLAVALLLSALLVGTIVCLCLHRPGDGTGDWGDQPRDRPPATLADPQESAALDTVEAPTETPEDNLTPPPPEAGAILIGRVTDPAGAELQGARVLVCNVPKSVLGGGFESQNTLRELALGLAKMDPSEVVAQTATDARGDYSFSISDISRGDYQVLAVMDGMAPASERWSWTPETSRIDFHLLFGEGIAGLVVAPDGSPVEGALVEARRERETGDPGRFRELVDQTRSDVRGRFHLNVGGATYAVGARADGYAPIERPRVPPLAQDLVLKLSESRTIQGIVRDEEETVVAGASVSLYRTEGSFQRRAMQLHLFDRARAQSVSDAGGRFQFSDLTPGRYSVLVEMRTFRPRQESVELAERMFEEVAITLQRGRAISGRVTDTEGAPLAGAYVVVSRSDSGPGGEEEKERGDSPSVSRRSRRLDRRPLSLFWASAAIETAADGTFRVDTLEETVYKLSAQADGFVAHRQEDIDLEEQDRVVEIVLDSGSRLEGEVRSTVGDEPVPGARLVFRRDKQYLEVETDGEGRYRADGFVQGDPLSLQVDADGYMPAVIGHVRVEPAGEASSLDIRLDPAGSISGQIVDPDGDPVPLARVRVEEVPESELKPVGNDGARRSSREAGSGRRQRARRSAAAFKTGADGLFFIEEVDPDRPMRLRVDHRDFQEHRGEPFSLLPGELLEDVVVRLRRGSVLIVAIRDPEGLAVSGARVRVSRQPAPGAVPEDEATLDRVRAPAPTGSVWGISDDEGLAVFSGLVAGPHLVSSSVERFQPFEGAVRLADDGIVEFPMQLLDENVLLGVVTDTAGDPLADVYAGALIETSRSEPRQLSWTRSTKDGTFRIGNLGHGPYGLWVERRGFAPQLLHGIAVNSPQRIVLERLGSIAGRVTGRDSGEPVREFEIRLAPRGRSATGDAADEGRGRFDSGSSDLARWRTFLASQGAFRLDEVTPGSYSLEVTASGFTDARIPVDVGEGEAVEVSVRLLEGASVTGSVRDAESGQPVAAAEVFLAPAPSNGPLDEEDDLRDDRGLQPRHEPASSLWRHVRRNGTSLESDLDGSFRFLAVTGGRYTLLVHHQDYVPSMRTIAVRDDRGSTESPLMLERGETLRGRITLAGQPPPAGLTIVFEDAGGLQKRVVTDLAGRYLATGFLPGTYSARVRRREGTESVVQITIEKGENELDYDIRD